MRIKTKYGLIVMLAILILSLLIKIPFPGEALAKEKTRYYLVGVGSGDPDLITLRGLKKIKEADLIFTSPGIKKKFSSYLEGKEVFEDYWRLFPYYGKDCSLLKDKERHQCEEISRKRNEFIARVRRAIKKGKTVAVLDSGDALIYGTFSWSLEEFADLKPVVIPGISSFNAGNAALGREVAVGKYTKSIILTTDDWPGKTDTIANLSTHQATMVIFTMKTEFENLIKKLSVNYPPQTPVAVVLYAGYQEKERVIRGSLKTILGQVKDEGLPFEHLLYVGDFLTYQQKQVK
jgi:precorrin-4/cobalt-precorrin-4 C11-methyltransferase